MICVIKRGDVYCRIHTTSSLGSKSFEFGLRAEPVTGERARARMTSTADRSEFSRETQSTLHARARGRASPSLAPLSSAEATRLMNGSSIRSLVASDSQWLPARARNRTRGK